MNQVEVLIVGAGPSGLMIALELARYGIPFRIIDQEEKPTNLSKALAIQARTLEIFQQIGIVNDFLQEGLILKGANPTSGRERLFHIDFSLIPSPFPFVLSLEQSKTEKILIKHLESYGVAIERGIKLTSFEEKENAVVAELLHLKGNKKESVQTNWLIGCDGAHSVVRRGLHLPFKGKVFSDIFSLADLHLNWPYPKDEIVAFLEADGVMAAFPIPGEHRYRLIFQMKRCQNKLKELSEDKAHGIIESPEIPPPSLEEVQEILNKYVGSEAKAYDPIWMSNFHINSRLSTHYRKNRVFLLGDAAHIHSPVGGQGMNTGLQDAFNLAWKLAFVIEGKAPISLLDSFEKERHYVGKTLLLATEEASSMALRKNKWIVALRNAVIKKMAKYASVQKKLARLISQTAICYPKSPIIKSRCRIEDGPKAGVRAPDIPLLLDQNLTTLYNLRKLAKCYIALIFVKDLPAREIEDSLQELRESLPPSLCQILVIAENPLYLTIQQTVAYDPDLIAHQTFGVKKRGIYIIRPDGYISFQSKRYKPKHVIDHLKRQIHIEQKGLVS